MLGEKERKKHVLIMANTCERNLAPWVANANYLDQPSGVYSSLFLTYIAGGPRKLIIGMPPYLDPTRRYFERKRMVGQGCQDQP